MARFYPDDAPVPDELRTEHFWLRPLRTTDAELDYEAVMESRERLRRWGGGDWPSDDFTLAENWQDLDMHEREHLVREAFTYTVLNPSGTECLGCVYLTPLETLLRGGNVLAAMGDDEVVVRFWIRESRLAEGLDEKLLEVLEGWFTREWAFSRVAYRTNANDPHQVELLERCGHHLYTVDVPGRVGPYLVYG